MFPSGVMISGPNISASTYPLTNTTIRRGPAGTQYATLPYFFIERYIPSYVAQWEAFAEAVRGGLPSPVTGNDGRAPLLIGLAAWKSIREKRPVNISEVT